MRILICLMMAYTTSILAVLHSQEPVKQEHIAGSATLRVRVVYRGEIPTLPVINSASDPVCANLAIPNETLIVGKEGTIEIDNLPIGENVFRLWHEAQSGRIEKVVINGKELAIDRNRIAFKLDAGLNDLGIIELRDSQFNIDPGKK